MAESSIPSNLSDHSISYIDHLRITACVFVVFAHVTGGSADGFTPFSSAWWTCKGLYFLCTWTMPVFVMISGALLLHRTSRSFKAFYGRRIQRIGIPLVFWTVFYLVTRVVIDGESLTGPRILGLLLEGNPYVHLWFLYMIVGLYLVTPFLQILVKYLSTEHCVLLAALILIAGDLYHLCNVMAWGRRPTLFTQFIPFIGYYMLGHVIHHRLPRGQLPGAWVAGGATASVLYLICLARPFIQMQGQQFGIFLFGFFSVPAAFIGITLYWAFRESFSRPLGPRLRHLASCTLGIYVVHLVILKLMQIFLADEAADQDLWIGLILGTLIAFVVSYGLVAMLKKIPVICRIVA